MHPCPKMSIRRHYSCMPRCHAYSQLLRNNSAKIYLHYQTAGSWGWGSKPAFCCLTCQPVLNFLLWHSKGAGDHRELGIGNWLLPAELELESAGDSEPDLGCKSGQDSSPFACWSASTNTGPFLPLRCPHCRWAGSPGWSMTPSHPLGISYVQLVHQGRCTNIVLGLLCQVYSRL